jgi:hypothetical protein
MKLDELKNLYKNLNVTFKDDLTLKRAILYYKFVKATYDFLTSDSVKQELNKIIENGYEKVTPALTQSPLLKGLCKILDKYTVPAVNTALLQANTTYGDYFTNLFQNSDAVDTFLNTHTLVNAALTTLSKSFQQNILTACKRVLKDWKLLDEMFPKLNYLANLSEIQSTGSDFHKGGQQVLILKFNLKFSGQLQIVYKPSDLEVDCLIIGDSQAVNHVLGSKFQDSSLMEILNKLIGQHPDCGLQPFPTYKMLPINPGSKLVANSDNTLPIRESYGYIEYLDQYDDPTSYEFPSFNQGKSNFKIYKHQDRMAICTRFGALLGQVAAVAGIFSICDLHLDNLIVHNYLPYLIDLENSLTRQIVKLSDTEMLSGTVGAVDAVLIWGKKSAAKDDEKQIGESTTIKSKKNRLWANPNQVISTTEYCGAAVNGLVGTINLLQQALAKPGEQQLFTSWFQRLQQGAIVRVIPLETAGFESSINAAYQKCGDMDSFKALLQQSMTQYYSSKHDAWAKNPTMDLPTFLCLGPDYLTGDFANFDIPVFYHKLTTCDVINSAGKKITIPLEFHQQLNRTTYFSAPPIQQVQYVQLIGLADNTTCTARIKAFQDELKKFMQNDVGRNLFQEYKK